VLFPNVVDNANFRTPERTALLDQRPSRRAKLLQRFCSRPFSVSEPYTAQPSAYFLTIWNFTVLSVSRPQRMAKLSNAANMGPNTICTNTMSQVIPCV
jgi:hypothetical protein